MSPSDSNNSGFNKFSPISASPPELSPSQRVFLPLTPEFQLPLTSGAQRGADFFFEPEKKLNR